MLELIRERPNWFGALSVALTRPPGVPERRHGENPWERALAGRPRRITDDLAWLRQALDDPEANGLRPMAGSAAIAAWSATDATSAEKLRRLRDRHVLQAGGFTLSYGVAARMPVVAARFERP